MYGVAFPGRQHVRNLRRSIDATCQGAVHRGHPHVVTCQEEVPHVPGELTAHFRDRLEHAGPHHAYGLVPSVDSREHPFVVAGERGAGGWVARRRATGA